MTDPNLDAKIASIQATLRHIEQELQASKDETREHRKDTSKQMMALVERMTRMEAKGVGITRLEGQVHKNELGNAAQEARYDAAEKANENVRKAILVGTAIAGTISSILALVIAWAV